MKSVDKIHLFTKELDLIQKIITRKSSHCFLVKGWAISLIFVSFLFNSEENQLLLALFPLIVFWYLDAFFTREVKMYKILYKWVASNRLKNDKYFFDLEPEKRFKKEIPSAISLMLSPQIFYLYGIMFLLVLSCFFINSFYF